MRVLFREDEAADPPSRTRHRGGGAVAASYPDQGECQDRATMRSTEPRALPGWRSTDDPLSVPAREEEYHRTRQYALSS